MSLASRKKRSQYPAPGYPGNNDTAVGFPVLQMYTRDYNQIRCCPPNRKLIFSARRIRYDYPGASPRKQNFGGEAKAARPGQSLIFDLIGTRTFLKTMSFSSPMHQNCVSQDSFSILFAVWYRVPGVPEYPGTRVLLGVLADESYEFCRNRCRPDSACRPNSGLQEGGSYLDFLFKVQTQQHFVRALRPCKMVFNGSKSFRRATSFFQRTLPTVITLCCPVALVLPKVAKTGKTRIQLKNSCPTFGLTPGVNTFPQQYPGIPSRGIYLGFSVGICYKY
eukprot:135276-Rhodomonas_salina.1